MTGSVKNICRSRDGAFENPPIAPTHGSAGSRLQARQTLLVPPLFEKFCDGVRAGRLTAANSAGLRSLLAEADAALTAGPYSVTDKKHLPPSGDVHDYFSLSVYFWPDSESPDGLPYVPRDGEPNPEIFDYDRPRFEEFCRCVDILALAYAATGLERYAEKAAALLRTWFVDEETRMNPNMLFAQFIPGDNVVLPWKAYPARFVPGADGRKGVWVSFGGTIEDHDLIPLTESVGLVSASPHWSATDQAAVVSWYRDYAEWLLTHQHGLDEAACTNNHGSWYWAGMLCFLNFSGQGERARTLAARAVPERLRIQIEPDGSQPEELVRTMSMSYTSYALGSFTNMALSAAQCGFNAWQFMTEDGRSIRKAVDWFIPYLTGESPWAWKQIKPYDPENAVGQLAACAVAYAEPAYLEIAKQLPGLRDDSLMRVLYLTE